MIEHLVFRIRSQAALALPTTRPSRRRLVTAVPAIGTKGRVVQQAAQLAVVLPERLLGKLPLFDISTVPHALPADVVSNGLRRAKAVCAKPIDEVIWLLPPASNQRSMAAALLIAGGTPQAHLRLDIGAPTRPNPALPSTTAGPRSGVGWPQLLDHWTDEAGWGEVTTAFGLAQHQSTDLSLDELAALEADLSDCLALPGPPPHPGWQPMHGDLTRWNLRTYPDGSKVLFDWEDAAWGPPHADLVRHLSTRADGPEAFEALPPERKAAAVDALLAATKHAEEAAELHANDRWKSADDADLLARLRSMTASASES